MSSICKYSHPHVNILATHGDTNMLTDGGYTNIFLNYECAVCKRMEEGFVNEGQAALRGTTHLQMRPSRNGWCVHLPPSHTEGTPAHKPLMTVSSALCGTKLMLVEIIPLKKKSSMEV